MERQRKSGERGRKTERERENGRERKSEGKCMSERKKERETSCATKYFVLKTTSKYFRYLQFT